MKTHEDNIHLGAGLGQIQNMAGLNLVFAKWNYTYWQLNFVSKFRNLTKIILHTLSGVYIFKTFTYGMGKLGISRGIVCASFYNMELLRQCGMFSFYLSKFKSDELNTGMLNININKYVSSIHS